LPQSHKAILQDLKNDIDIPTFTQILDMDSDEEREFSRTLVFEFLNQAKDTFAEIEGSLYVDHRCPLQ
jgi:osomolarity two-component system phosphorelay intermediate protein YPD1